MENEKKYTQEEIMAIVDGEIRKAGLTPARELNPDEMEKVSGGHGARIPSLFFNQIRSGNPCNFHTAVFTPFGEI